MVYRVTKEKDKSFVTMNQEVKEMKTWPPTKEEFTDMLLVQKLRPVDIAKMYNVGKGAVSGMTFRLGLTSSGRGMYPERKSEMKDRARILRNERRKKERENSPEYQKALAEKELLKVQRLHKEQERFVAIQQEIEKEEARRQEVEANRLKLLAEKEAKKQEAKAQIETYIQAKKQEQDRKEQERNNVWLERAWEFGLDTTLPMAELKRKCRNEINKKTKAAKTKPLNQKKLQEFYEIVREYGLNADLDISTLKVLVKNERNRRQMLVKRNRQEIKTANKKKKTTVKSLVKGTARIAVKSEFEAPVLIVAVPVPVCTCKPKSVAKHKRDPHGCKFIHGEVRDSNGKIGDWHYCQKPLLEGKSWCQEHYNLCYAPRVRNSAVGTTPSTFKKKKVSVFVLQAMA